MTKRHHLIRELGKCCHAGFSTSKFKIDSDPTFNLNTSETILHSAGRLKSAHVRTTYSYQIPIDRQLSERLYAYAMS